MPEENQDQSSPGGTPRDKDSLKNIIIVALSVCLACAIVVSGAAVALKPQQVSNKALDRNKNILIAAGLFEPGVTKDGDIDELFKQFEVRMVDLEEHRLLSEADVQELGIDPNRYDQRKAAKEPALSRALASDEDIASINRRARYSTVYLLRKEGEIDRIVLPVHGYGLWSTLYGFIAMQADGQTVAGITFYEHKETAGLGGEVDNPAWKAQWSGKKIYDSDGDVALRVVKGGIDHASPMAKYQVDALSGATLTSKGVENLVAYWLGESAFGPVLKHLEG